MTAESLIILTDLDGTFLDLNTYSYREAEEALSLVKSKRIPLVFCSAKTRLEQEAYQERLKIIDPFIVENGGAIFIRKGYFNFPYPFQKSVAHHHVIELGIPYARIRRALEQIKQETAVRFRSCTDMTAQEFALETGLNLQEAKMALMRDYDEVLKMEPSAAELERFRQALSRHGLRCTFGGRFYHVLGPNDKGKAAAMVVELFRKGWGPVRTIGIGDNANDEPLLAAVDLPLLVQQPSGGWAKVDLPNLRRIDGIGPAGWNKAVLELLAA